MFVIFVTGNSSSAVETPQNAQNGPEEAASERHGRQSMDLPFKNKELDLLSDSD